jgi:hypothetical protein
MVCFELNRAVLGQNGRGVGHRCPFPEPVLPLETTTLSGKSVTAADACANPSPAGTNILAEEGAARQKADLGAADRSEVPPD